MTAELVKIRSLLRSQEARLILQQILDQIATAENATPPEIVEPIKQRTADRRRPHATSIDSLLSIVDDDISDYEIGVDE